MEWRRDQKAASGECAPASTRRRGWAAPLARWESQVSSTCMHTPSASPTGGGATGTGRHAQSRWPAFASFQGITGARSTLVGDTTGAQCATQNFWPSDHSTLRRPGRFCRHARVSQPFACEHEPRATNRSLSLSQGCFAVRFTRDVSRPGVLLSIGKARKIPLNTSLCCEQENCVMVRIRAYQAEDQDRLEACILELQNFERTLEPDRVEGVQIVARKREELLAIVRQNRGQIFVAEVNAEVVGCVGVRLEHEEGEYLSSLVDYAYISDLVVLPSHRGQGYGTMLLQKAEEFARQRGMTMLKIHVLVKNQQATSVYLHADFRPYALALLKSLE